MLDDRNIARLDQIAFLQKLFVDAVNGTLFKPLYRQLRHSVFFLDANDDIASAPVIYVVCKRTDGVQNRLRVPVALVFHTGIFYHPAVDEVGYVDWQSHCESSFDALL